MFWLSILLPLLAFSLAIIGRGFLKQQMRRAQAKRNETNSGERCVCGYPLKELDMARCPECGRVIHFNATAEELGLTPEELQRAQLKRQQRAKR